MEDRVFPFGRDVSRIRPLAVGHAHRDLPPEMLFVEAECLFAVTAVIEICVELHREVLPFDKECFSGLRVALASRSSTLHSHPLQGSGREAFAVRLRGKQTHRSISMR